MNQSWTRNWIHAAASTLRIVAGWNVVRVKQLQADAARVRRHQIGGIGERLAQRDVAPEPHAGAAHARTGQVVVGAVAGAGIPHLPGRRRGGAFERRLLGVVQVLLAQLVAKLDQLRGRDRTGKLVPFLIEWPSADSCGVEGSRVCAGRHPAGGPPASPQANAPPHSCQSLHAHAHKNGTPACGFEYRTPASEASVPSQWIVA